MIRWESDLLLCKAITNELCNVQPEFWSLLLFVERGVSHHILEQRSKISTLIDDCDLHGRLSKLEQQAGAKLRSNLNWALL